MIAILVPCICMQGVHCVKEAAYDYAVRWTSVVSPSPSLLSQKRTSMVPQVRFISYSFLFLICWCFECPPRYIYIYIYTHFKTQFLWIYEQIGRWRVIKMIAGKGSALRDIVGKESELVEKIYSWGLIKSQYKFVKHIYIFPWWHLIGLENHICRFLFVCISASDQTNDFWNTTFDEICPKLY
jgi:hypothetical protein